MNSFLPHVTTNLDENVSTFEFSLNGAILTVEQALDFIETLSKRNFKELWAYQFDGEGDLLIFNSLSEFYVLKYNGGKIYSDEVYPFRLFSWLPTPLIANFVGRSESIQINYVYKGETKQTTLNKLFRV